MREHLQNCGHVRHVVHKLYALAVPYKIYYVKTHTSSPLLNKIYDRQNLTKFMIIFAMTKIIFCNLFFVSSVRGTSYKIY